MTGRGPGSTRSQSFSMCLLSSVMLLWVRICHNTCALHVLHFAPFSRAVSDIWWLLWAVFNWSNWIMHLLHVLLLADLHSFLAELFYLWYRFGLFRPREVDFPVMTRCWKFWSNQLQSSKLQAPGSYFATRTCWTCHLKCIFFEKIEYLNVLYTLLILKLP